MTQSSILKLTINGKPYEVEVGDLSASPVEVVVNGTLYQVEVQGGAPIAVGTPAPVTVAAPVARPAPAVSPAAPVSTPVPAPAPVAASANTVRSPMPGTILDVVVKAGDTIKAGQQLCALEAMKMKSAIKSPRDGKIASVHVTNGQKVQYNDVLVAFE